MRLDLHVHIHDGDPDELRLIMKGQGEIMSKIDDLNAKIADIKTIVTDLAAAVDAFIASDAANFQALKDALANIGATDPAVQAAIDALEATRTELAGQKDKIVAADAADNLTPG